MNASPSAAAPVAAPDVSAPPQPAVSANGSSAHNSEADTASSMMSVESRAHVEPPSADASPIATTATAQCSDETTKQYAMTTSPQIEVLSSTTHSPDKRTNNINANVTSAAGDAREPESESNPNSTSGVASVAKHDLEQASSARTISATPALLEALETQKLALANGTCRLALGAFSRSRG